MTWFWWNYSYLLWKGSYRTYQLHAFFKPERRNNNWQCWRFRVFWWSWMAIISTIQSNLSQSTIQHSIKTCRMQIFLERWFLFYFIGELTLRLFRVTKERNIKVWNTKYKNKENKFKLKMLIVFECQIRDKTIESLYHHGNSVCCREGDSERQKASKNAKDYVQYKQISGIQRACRKEKWIWSSLSGCWSNAVVKCGEGYQYWTWTRIWRRWTTRPVFSGDSQRRSER